MMSDLLKANFSYLTFLPRLNPNTERTESSLTNLSQRQLKSIYNAHLFPLNMAQTNNGNRSHPFWHIARCLFSIGQKRQKEPGKGSLGRWEKAESVPNVAL